MDNFDLKQYLVENKLTYQEKMKDKAKKLKEEKTDLTEGLGTILTTLALANLLSYTPSVIKKMKKIREKNLAKIRNEEEREKREQEAKRAEENLAKAEQELKGDISQQTISKIKQDKEIQDLLTQLANSVEAIQGQDFSDRWTKYSYDTLKKIKTIIKEKYGKEGENMINALDLVFRSKSSYGNAAIHVFDDFLALEKNKIKDPYSMEEAETKGKEKEKEEPSKAPKDKSKQGPSSLNEGKVFFGGY